MGVWLMGDWKCHTHMLVRRARRGTPDHVCGGSAAGLVRADVRDVRLLEHVDRLRVGQPPLAPKRPAERVDRPPQFLLFSLRLPQPVRGEGARWVPRRRGVFCCSPRVGPRVGRTRGQRSRRGKRR